MTPLSRRSVLVAGAGVGAALTTGVAYAAPGAPQPTIHPRADWAGGLQPKGPLRQEKPGEVKFLLIHHSESPNTDRPGSTPERLRGFYRFHTSAEKGWPDVAYNFFVDRFGEIWEGRTGSLAGPVMGDATGGSQGYAQLACFVGDHSTAPPTPEAMTAMTRLLAWLAARYAIDLAPGSTVSFPSRGSNRWPAGKQVTTDPVAGHRDMSQTACPGDALYPLVRSALAPGAHRLLGTPSPGQSTAASASPSTVPTPEPEPPRWSTQPVGVRSAVPTPAGAEPAAEQTGIGSGLLIGGGVVGAGALAAGAVALSRATRGGR